jgi:hypothetical protein
MKSVLATVALLLFLVETSLGVPLRKPGSLARQASVLASFTLHVSAITGGLANHGTVSLETTAAADTAVTVTSNKPTVALPPTTITVLKGTQSVGLSVSTTGVDIETNVILSASYNGVVKTVPMNVVPATILSLTCVPSAITGGNGAQCRIVLTGMAGPAGTSVNVSTTGPISVPKSIKVLAQTTQTTFNVQSSPVTGVDTCPIHATVGTIMKSATLLVGPSSLLISSASINIRSMTLNGWFALGGTNTSVTVGGVAAGNLLVNPRTITCTLPPSPIGPVKIIVQSEVGGRTLSSNALPFSVVIGRYDAIMNRSGRATGDIGLLITSQDGYLGAGSISGTPVRITVSSDGHTLRFTQPTEDLGDIQYVLTLNGSTFKGVVTQLNWDAAFLRESATPSDPYIGGPQVKSVSMPWSATLGEFTIVATWDRPVGESWDFDISQGANFITGVEGADQANISYSASSSGYAYTMPIVAYVGLTTGNCTLTLPHLYWNDPYGVTPASDWVGSFTLAK